MREKLASFAERFDEVLSLMGDPQVVSDQKLYRELASEHRHLEPLVHAWRQLTGLESELADSRSLLKDSDPDMREMAREEVSRLGPAIEEIEQSLRILLLPRDPNDEKNVILEIRAGTGGDEAALFAADVYRMYQRYAEANSWRIEVLDVSENDIGGFKEVVCSITGASVFSRLKFESGVHRVQRVPSTETQGRIHTSACTVAILPEADDVEVEVNDSELRIDTYRASGAGGQHVNKTESAIRITHLPSGLVVTCQDEKSQHKNKAKAMKILRARLFEQMEAEAHAERAADRKSQVGSGDRSERIRTYNYPQNRLTDHRINLTLYKLDQIVQGAMDMVIEPLIQQHQADLMMQESA